MLHVDVTMLDDDINKLHVMIGDKLIVQLYKGTNDNCKQMYIYLSLAYISISCINMQTKKWNKKKRMFKSCLRKFCCAYLFLGHV